MCHVTLRSSPEGTPDTVGEWLRQLRAKRRQQEVADAMGIERTYLSKLETGKRPVTDELIPKIAKVHELDVAEVSERVELERQRLRVSPAQLVTFAQLLERLDQLLARQEERLGRQGVPQADDTRGPSAQ